VRRSNAKPGLRLMAPSASIVLNSSPQPGMEFDGLYYVKSVTSTLKQGEFKQRFSLTRNGLISITPVVPV